MRSGRGRAGSRSRQRGGQRVRRVRQPHLHRRCLGAAQCERGATDAYRHGVTAGPHAGDDLAMRAAHEAEIAEPGDERFARASTRVDGGGLDEPDDNGRFAAAQFSQRLGRDALIRRGKWRFHA